MVQTLREQDHHKLLVMPTPPWVRSIGLTVATGIAYFLSARLGLALLTKPDGVAVFWPAAGVGAGLLIALGPGARWPVAVATVGATMAANLLADRNIPLATVVALCAAGAVLLIAWLIERYFGPHFALNSVPRVLGLMAATAIGAAVSGIASTAGFVYFHSSATSIPTIWQHWVAAGALGVVAIAPLLIGIASAIRDPPPRQEFIEGFVALTVLSAVVWLAVLRLQAPWMVIVPAATMFPLLLWLAARCRPVFSSMAAFVVGVTALCTTTFGLGHFFSADLPVDDRILATQVVILGASLCALVLSALFAERREHEAALIKGEARLQEALTAGAVMAFEGDVSTGLAKRSENAAKILGYDPQEYLSDVELRSFAKYCSRIHPDDRARFEASVYGVRPDNPSHSIAYRFFRFDDGREVWLESTSRTEFDAAGRRRRVSGLIRDITERKRAEERQNVLMAELDHRVKNVLARVAVVAGCTRQGSRTMDEFVQVFDGRIQSMAAAHALLSQSRWQGVDLTDLIRHQLAPYTTEDNTAIAGPKVMLSDALTQAVAMVLHELVTNAAKYGALSVPAGRVSVSWSKCRNGNGAESLMLEWREMGGPPVLAAVKPGYGTSLIRDLIPHELGGTVDLVFAAKGVCCRIETPLG